jgi:hypothetical protein
MRHVQRVAALDVAGSHDVDVRDRAAVAARYATLSHEAPPQAPVATALAALGGVLALIACVWLVIYVRTPERAARRAIPLPAGAFFHGGMPLEDDALATLFMTELPQLVIETDADRRGSSEGAARARHVQELKFAPAIAAYGPGLTRAWYGLIDTLDRWTDISVHERRFKKAVAELGLRAQEVSDQLAALGIGYYLSSDVMVKGSTAHAVVFAYRVEDVALVRAGGVARRVLSLRRIDPLNIDLALLGRQGDELGDPVVLLDQVQDFTVNRVLPVLSREPYRLGDGDWRRTSQAGRLLASDAADAIEGELRAAIGTHDESKIETAVRLFPLVIGAVRRHEARHAIDLDRERPLRYPEPMKRLLGARDGSTTRAELELAAYTSQIANEPVIPQWTLWNLASHAFAGRFGGAESYVAVIVLEGLARQLGHVPSRPVVIAGRLDREALANLARPLAHQSSDKLRAAARALWIEFYGEPLVPIVDVRPAR